MAVVQQVFTADHCISWINLVGITPGFDHEVAVLTVDDDGCTKDIIEREDGLNFSEAEAVFLRYCRKYKYE